MIVRHSWHLWHDWNLKIKIESEEMPIKPCFNFSQGFMCSIKKLKAIAMMQFDSDLLSIIIEKR